MDGQIFTNSQMLKGEEIMKKLFVSILALAAFAACQSNFNDVTTNTPGLGDDVVPEGMVRIYAEVGIGEEGTKATYDDNLNAKWEESDQIALLQESANYGGTFGHVNSLNIKSGAGTSYAAFNGDITVPTESPRIYHIAYPASAVKFTTNVSVVKSGDSSYETKESSPGIAYFRSKANFDYEYTSSVSVNVPTTQNGKWEPYMYASTSEAVNSNAIGAKTLTTLTGAIAIRAYEADGTTPKQLKSIAVTATKPIAGAFSGESASVATLNVTGDYTSNTYSTEIDGDFIIEGRNKAKAAADELLESKAQSTVPANTSVTKALSLAFVGDQYTVGAEDTAWVVADENGVYTYHLNVAPFEGADLTIIATAMDGSTLVRTISAQSLAAGHRKGYVFKWEEATLSVGSIETWYDDCDTTIGLEGNTLYVNNLEVKGVSADQVLTLGVNIDGTLHEATAKSGVLTIDQIKISDMANDQHTVFAYAKVLVNGQEKELFGNVATKTITSIPTITGFTVKTSYSNDGTVAKDNNFDGNKMTMNADISDAYFKTAGLVKSYTFYYGNKSVNPTLGTAKDITFAPSEWGQYDCYVKIELKNDYVLESNAIESYVTGIPCEADWTKADYSDWSLVTCSDKGSNLEVARNKTGGFFTPVFKVPAATGIKVQYEASSLQPTESKRKIYVAVVGGSATSLDTSSSENFRYHNEANSSTYSYQTWSKTNLSISNGQKVSAAFNAGSIYTVLIRKFKVEYK